MNVKKKGYNFFCTLPAIGEFVILRYYHCDFEWRALCSKEKERINLTDLINLAVRGINGLINDSNEKNYIWSIVCHVDKPPALMPRKRSDS